MKEELKLLAHKTVDTICRKVRKAASTDFYKFGNNIGIGADGTITKYIDKIAEDVALRFINKSKIIVNINMMRINKILAFLVLFLQLLIERGIYF